MSDVTKRTLLIFYNLNFSLHYMGFEPMLLPWKGNVLTPRRIMLFNLLDKKNYQNRFFDFRKIKIKIANPKKDFTNNLNLIKLLIVMWQKFVKHLIDNKSKISLCCVDNLIIILRFKKKTLIYSFYVYKASWFSRNTN